MINSFTVRLLGSALTAILCSVLFPFLLSGKINVIAFNFIVLTVYLIGCSIGERTANYEQNKNIKCENTDE